MNPDVAIALQTAKYIETVQLQVEDEAGSTHDLSLVACLDDENGGIRWESMDASFEDPNSRRNVIRRHLRTKKWFFPMLNDSRRNELYDRAIEGAAREAVRRVRSISPTQSAIHALDIGSGTGLLAMMASKRLKEATKETGGDLEVKVTSVEMSRAMASIATEVIDSNCAPGITVKEAHSAEMPGIGNSVMFCTSELLESGLLAEGWVPALRDAWERHLHPSAVVVPSGAKVIAQVVEGAGLSGYWGPHQKVHHFPNDRSLSFEKDGAHLLTNNNSHSCGIQVPIHVERLLGNTELGIRPLSEPMVVLDIRVDSKEAIPQPCGGRKTSTFIPTASGKAQGVLFWWDLDLFASQYRYSTEPGDSSWQDHWQQCVFVFSKPVEDCSDLKAGVSAEIQCFHNDSSLAFEVVGNGDTEVAKASKVPRLSPSIHNLISPLRAWQLNDTNRLGWYRDCLTDILSRKGLSSMVLDLSDFSLCAIMAALLGAHRVTSLECSSSSLPQTTAHIAQITNGLPLDEKDRFEILRCHPESLTTDILGGQAEIVVAEPYYEVLEGWVIEEALNFFYLVKNFRRRSIISESAEFIPSRAFIKAVAFESSEVGKAYAKSNRTISTFNHDAVNQYYDCGKYDIPIESWQYKIDEISSVVDIGVLDYTNSKIILNDDKGRSMFLRKGVCHGLLFWVEYGTPSLSKPEKIRPLSTKGHSYKQVVRLLPEPRHVTSADSFECNMQIGQIAETNCAHDFEIKIVSGVA